MHMLPPCGLVLPDVILRLECQLHFTFRQAHEAALPRAQMAPQCNAKVLLLREMFSMPPYSCHMNRFHGLLFLVACQSHCS